MESLAACEGSRGSRRKGIPMPEQTPPTCADDPVASITEIVARARVAQATFETYSQQRVDDVVAAVAWAIYEPERALALAELAVQDTGLGRVEDKVVKNQRKTLGTLRDLTGAPSVGVIREDVQLGITEYAKPVGVVAAVCPSTNPAATPANKTLMALKGRNAVVISPSPKGASTAAMLVRYMHAELDKVGAPRDLVQSLAAPSKPLTNELMNQADLVVVTGSQRNVRQAYSSGTPALGVGAGNAPVIIEADADVEDAAAKIKQSKIFDYSTSCSSENSVHITDTVYAEALAALRNQGGYLLTPAEKDRLQTVMWPDGKLSSAITAQPPGKIAALAGLDSLEAREADFFMVEEEGVGPEHPFSGEKLSVVLTVYRYHDLDSALDRIQRLLDFQGAGHSCGIHTRNVEHAHTVARRLRVARVLVNQAHCFGTGGGFDNGLGFTLTMGAGTWAGNSISDNLSYRHFLNITRLAQVIPPRVPTEEQLWGNYFERYGR
ncbi:acylating sulfoacetaldehyde dehydrogenase [Rhodococcus opacus]